VTVAVVWIATDSADAQAAVEILTDHSKDADDAYGRNDLDLALEFLQMGMGLIRELDEDAALRGACYAYLGKKGADWYRSQDEFDLALDWLSESESLLGDSEQDRVQAVGVACLRGLVHLDNGRLDLASDELRVAKSLMSDLAEVPANERVRAQRLEISLYEAREDYESVIELSRAALADEKLYEGFPQNRAVLMVKLGRALGHHSPQGELVPESRMWLRRALEQPGIDVIDKVVAQLGLAEWAVETRDWGTAEKWLDSAQRTLASSQQPARRWRSWYDVLRARSGRPDKARIEAEFAAKLEGWSSRKDRSGGQGFLHYTRNKSLVSELIATVLEEGGPSGAELALTHLLRAQDAGTLARRLGCEGTTVTDIRELLLKDRAVAILVYFPAEYQSHVFVLKSDSIECFELDPIDELQVRQSKLAMMMLRPARPSDEEEAGRRDAARAQVSEYLFPPSVRAALGDRRKLVFVGRDLLGEVFFEALPLGESEYLGTSYEVSNLPSLSVGALLAKRQRAESFGPRRVVLVGSPSVDEELLPGAAALADRDTLERMITSYSPSERTILSGTGATFEAARENVGSASVLQIFTHGHLDRERERSATFLLTPDESSPGLVGADEIEACSFDAPPLTLLTVCRSGREPTRRGDAGAAGIAGSLFVASKRSRCVVLSSFDLDSNAALQFAKHFHQAIRAGASPAEGARQARRHMTRGAFEDPYYHALIRVVGLANEPIFAR